jgi:hypothetical protein
MKYLKKTYPRAIKHVGILWANATPSTSQTEQAVESAMRSQGFDIVYDRGYTDTEFTFLSDVLAMKAKGVQLFYSLEMPDFDAATLAKEMQQQDFRPMVIQGAAYSGALLTDAGGAANGMYIVQGYPLYLPGEDSKKVPAAALFDHWMNVASSSPNFEIEAVYGWMSAELFVQALKNAGSPPTRSGLIAALDKITSFDAGGMISPSNPAKNIPASCFILPRSEVTRSCGCRPARRPGSCVPQAGCSFRTASSPKCGPHPILDREVDLCLAETSHRGGDLSTALIGRVVERSHPFIPPSMTTWPMSSPTCTSQ